MQTLFNEDTYSPTPPQPAVRPPRKPRRKLKAAIGAVAAAALFFAGAALTGSGPDPDPAGAAPVAIPAVAQEPATREPLTTQPTTTAPATTVAPVPLRDASEVGAVVIPSVVTIQINGNGTSVVGSGSGVVYSTDGYIITNAHVVDAGAGWQVVLSDGRNYEADLIGIDFATDLAVLQIEAGDLKPIGIGSTDTLDVGDPAIAVGSPLGLEGGPSLSVGVVSAFDRIVRVDPQITLYGMLQADAPITQGSSGGALVDGRGRLIGITSAVGVSEVGVEGIGFSSPIEIVLRVVDEIIADGEATNPFLGITGRTAFGPTGDGGQQPIGVEVNSIEAGSAAEAAGISEGDVVTSIEGTTITTMQDLVGSLRRFSAGDTIDLTVGPGDPTPIRVTLGNG